MPGNLYVCDIAGMMKGNEKLVLEPASVAANWNSGLRSSLTLCPADVVFSRQTRHETS